MTDRSGPRGVRLVRRLVLLGLLTVLPLSPVRGQIGIERLDPPRPVVLVPGWGDDAGEMDPLRERLLAAGWSPEQVVEVQFADPVGSNEEHAREVKTVVEALAEETDSGRVDVVAHSMGGLAVRWYLELLGGATRVRRAVFLGTPNRGTLAAYLAWGEGGEEMEPGSEFLAELNDHGAVPDGVRAITIRTPVDLRVIPPRSAALYEVGVTNLEICCPTHRGLLDHDETFVRIRNFLRQPAAEVGGSDGKRR